MKLKLAFAPLALVLAAAAIPADARRPKEPQGPVELPPPSEIAPPAIALDLNQPAKLRAALQKNRWLDGALQGPLGKGFLGSWSAFLGSRGEDLRASFKGAVRELALSTLLAQPLRVAWYTAGRTSAPALIVPKPGEALRAAWSAIDQIARRGAVTSRCPGDTGPGALIGRWTLAEHALFTALTGDRLLIARHPSAIMQALCGALPALQTGADAVLSFAPARISRGAQVGAALAGLDESIALQLDVDGDRLVPRGIAGPLAARGRLASAPASDALLKLLPASAAVVLSANLALPDALDNASLRAFWKDGKAAHTTARRATIAWWPRGDAHKAQEVALIWSRADDDAALSTIFLGKNALIAERVCDHAVLASTPEVLARLRSSCAGNAPSFRDLGSRVTSPLMKESSLALAVQLGRALPALAEDGWQLEKGAPAPPPAEINEALQRLRELPFVGFLGAAEESAVVPRGFGT